jgi:hypothetical protein
MEAILKFQLPEEQEEYEITCRARDYHGVLWDVDNILRNYLKYGHKFKDADEALEDIRSQITQRIDLV